MGLLVEVPRFTLAEGGSTFFRRLRKRRLKEAGGSFRARSYKLHQLLQTDMSFRLQMDVTSKPSILAAVSRVKAEDGRLDILFNK